MNCSVNELQGVHNCRVCKSIINSITGQNNITVNYGSSSATTDQDKASLFNLSFFLQPIATNYPRRNIAVRTLLFLEGDVVSDSQ